MQNHQYIFPAYCKKCNECNAGIQNQGLNEEFCDICGTDFSYKKGDRHKTDRMKPREPISEDYEFECEICKLKFESEELLEKHSKDSHDNFFTKFHRNCAELEEDHIKDYVKFDLEDETPEEIVKSLWKVLFPLGNDHRRFFTKITLLKSEWLELDDENYIRKNHYTRPYETPIALIYLHYKKREIFIRPKTLM